jgi:hypothetical protein
MNPKKVRHVFKKRDVIISEKEFKFQLKIRRSGKGHGVHHNGPQN